MVVIVVVVVTVIVKVVVVNGFDHHILALLSSSSSEKGLKFSGLNGHSNPVLWNAGAVLHQLSYQANLKLVLLRCI